MAFHKPVLTTHTGSMDYVIKKGKTGLISEPGSAKELARNIELFLNPKVRKKLDKGIKGADEFTWKGYVDSLVDLAERAIDSNNLT
jgi:glycosyltransferase involved in cell wall biosynthesis